MSDAPLSQVAGPALARQLGRGRGEGVCGLHDGRPRERFHNEDDKAVSQNGVAVVMDGRGRQDLPGAEIDHKDELQGAQFVIKNPNATTTCGCGSSFSA